MSDPVQVVFVAVQIKAANQKEAEKLVKQMLYPYEHVKSIESYCIGQMVQIRKGLT